MKGRRGAHEAEWRRRRKAVSRRKWLPSILEAEKCQRNVCGAWNEYKHDEVEPIEVS